MGRQTLKHAQWFGQIYDHGTIQIPGGSSCEVTCDGYATAVFQVVTEGAVTINVYGTTTGDYWDLLEVISLAAAAHTWTQISASGLWTTGCAGLSRIRLTIDSQEDDVDIYAGLSTAEFNWPYCCAAQ